ncbi:MAG: class I SAM-dependent methyltransferase [Candidatus Methanomethylicaceae archaeon]
MGKRELIRDYNATAHLYDERYRQEQILKIGFLLGKIRPKEDNVLLDVGCGTGLLFEFVNCKFIVGIDISINMLKEARKRAGKNVELILGDAEFLPIKSGSADIVMSITVAQLFMDQERFMSEVKRSLKRGGVFGISLLRKAKVPGTIPKEADIYESENMKDIFCIGRKG